MINRRQFTVKQQQTPEEVTAQRSWVRGLRPVCVSSCVANVCIKSWFFHFVKWGRFPCLPAHRWPVWFQTGPVKGRLFQWISITEKWLARINHNKIELVVCHLSQIGYLGTLLKPLPSYAPVKQRRWGRAWRGFLLPKGKIFKRRLKYSSLFFSFFFERQSPSGSPAWHSCEYFCFSQKGQGFYIRVALYHCDHHIWISLINHPRHRRPASDAAGCLVTTHGLLSGSRIAVYAPL